MNLLLLLAFSAFAAEPPFYIRQMESQRDVSAMNENFRSVVSDIKQTVNLTDDQTVRGAKVYQDTSTFAGSASFSGPLVASSITVNGPSTLNGTTSIGIGGTPIVLIATGTFSPVISMTSNVASTGTATMQYIRVGSMVSYALRITNITTTGTGATELRINLAGTLASSITVELDAPGVCATNANEDSGVTEGAGTNLIRIAFDSINTNAKNWSCSGHFVIK